MLQAGRSIRRFFIRCLVTFCVVLVNVGSIHATPPPNSVQATSPTNDVHATLTTNNVQATSPTNNINASSSTPNDNHQHIQGRAASGPMCMDCKRLPSPSDCNHVIKCAEHEVCYVTQFVSDGGHVYYDTGCQASTRCPVNDWVNDSVVIRRAPGDIETCIECCQGNYCNLQGCSSQPIPDINIRGPMCFQCDVQDTPDSCETVVNCGPTNECFLSTLVIPLTNEVKYTSKCMTTSACDALRSSGLIGRRSSSCFGCCQEDFCNTNCSRAHWEVNGSTSATETSTTPTKPQTAPPTTTRLYVPTTTGATTTNNTTNSNVSTTTGATTTNTTTNLNASTTTGATTTNTTTNLNISTTMEATNPPSPPPSPIQQPSDWLKVCKNAGYRYINVTVSEKHYHYCLRVRSDVKLPWHQAQDTCKKDGGSLVVFHDKDPGKEDFGKWLQSLNIYRYWVGATDEGSKGNWTWVDGVAIRADYFGPGEPNNYGWSNGQHVDEHCAEAYFDGHRMFLYDDICETVSNFVCEIKL